MRSEFMNNITKASREESASVGGKVGFVKQTYQLFAASLMGGAVGAYVGMSLVGVISQYYWGFVILEFALLFGLMFGKKIKGLNILLLFSFVFVSGLTIAPLIASTLMLSSGGAIVANAFAMTSLIVASMSFFAIKTQKDFTSFQKPLMIAVLIIIGFSLLNVFLFESSIVTLAISSVAVLIFTFLVIIDTQNIIKGNYETPIDGAIALYLDFFNIFISLLSILNSTSQE